MLPIIGMAVGAAVRYLPNLFGFVGDRVKDAQDQKYEKERIALSLQLEESKAKAGAQMAQIQGESAEALATIQGSIEELKALQVDRQSARQYGQTLHNAMIKALGAGKSLGVWRWLLSLGWFSVLAVEALSALIQPMIAVCAFAMWIAWKVSLFQHGLDLSGGAVAIAAALAATWTENDWMLMDGVLGFFLAGRTQRYLDSRKK